MVVVIFILKAIPILIYAGWIAGVIYGIFDPRDVTRYGTDGDYTTIETWKETRVFRGHKFFYRITREPRRPQ